MNQIDSSVLKQEMENYIVQMKEELFTISDYIHKNPEMAFEEYKAQQILSDFLRSNGFTVEEKVGGLETSFLTSFCPTGIAYPTIDILGEYDALTIGHACGHNIIATTAVGAGAAVKYIMEKYQIPGTVRIVGTPAEESRGGKIIMQKNGVFGHTDAMILLHPTSGMTKIAGNCKSSYKLTAVYKGQAAHASSHPEDGINAADAANICYMAIGCLRNQLPCEVQVMPIIVDAGKENGLIPDRSQINISIRCFKLSYLTKALEKVKNCINAGALATGCSVEIEEIPGYQGRVCSHVLAEVVRSNFELLSEPVMPGMVDDNGGEDFGNLNRVVPGIMPYPTLLPEEKISNHTERFKALANSPKSREVLLLGSKVMAYTVLDLLLNPQIVADAKEELEKLKNTF